MMKSNSSDTPEKIADMTLQVFGTSFQRKIVRGTIAFSRQPSGVECPGLFVTHKTPYTSLLDIKRILNNNCTKKYAYKFTILM